MFILDRSISSKLFFLVACYRILNIDKYIFDYFVGTNVYKVISDIKSEGLGMSEKVNGSAICSVGSILQ